jgi:DNA repair photolyase
MSSAALATQHLEPARSVLRDACRTDAWFIARYGMNLYRGCQHACAYCDGRAERYHVAGDFARDIVVKSNALELLPAELDNLPEPGFVFLGGGVSDAWQPSEARHGLARGALGLLAERGLPVHALTKSALVERDLDLLQDIHQRSRAILSFSIQTMDDAVRQRFEPGAAPIPQRWRILREAKARGLVTGVMAMPVLPGISDQPEAIDALLARAADVGVDFVLWSGLTLRPGVQKAHFLEELGRHHPDLVHGYTRVYAVDQPSGGADPRYCRRVEDRFRAALDHHGLADRVPRAVFRGLMPQHVEAAVLLEHQQASLARAGQQAPWLGRSGAALQQWGDRALKSLGRRRGPQAWQQVEQRFREALERGELAQAAGLDTRALPILQAAVATMPPPRGRAQLSLL